MKTSTASASKRKGNGSSRQAHASDSPASSAAGEDCPREQMIAEAAYYRAEQRGFAPGYEMADWIEAEADVERLLGNIH